MLLVAHHAAVGRLLCHLNCRRSHLNSNGYFGCGLLPLHLDIVQVILGFEIGGVHAMALDLVPVALLILQRRQLARIFVCLISFSRQHIHFVILIIVIVFVILF